MGAISRRNDVKASRPFNKDRDGFVIAEGSWVFVIEELSHALSRKAKIYGELVGYGATWNGLLVQSRTGRYQKLGFV